MTNNNPANYAAIQIYHIRLKGHIDSSWSGWFGGLTITRTGDGETILSGPIVDQAALFGVLLRVQQLGLPLISVSAIAHADVDKTPL